MGLGRTLGPPPRGGSGGGAGRGRPGPGGPAQRISSEEKWWAEMSNERRVRIGVASAAGVLIAAVCGCDGRDAASTAIDESRVKFREAAVQPVEARAAAFGSAAAELEGVKTDKVHPATAAEVARLSGHARMAQGWHQLSAASVAVRAMAEGITSAESALADLESIESIRASLAGFDASDQVAALEAERGEFESQRDALAAQVAAAEAEAASIEAQAAAKGELARQEQAQEQALRVQAADVDAIGRVPLIEQAAQHARAAGDHELEQGELQLQLDMKRRAAADLAGKLAFAESGMESLTASLAKVRSTQGSIKAHVAELQGRADALRGELRERVDAVWAAYNGQVGPALDEAIGTLNQAAANARDARDGGEAAKMSAATIEHAAYIAASAKAQTLRGLAQVVDRIARSSVVPAGSYDELDRTLGEMVAEAEAAAEASASSASAAIGSAAGSGPAAERLQAIADALAAAGGEAAEEGDGDADLEPVEGDEAVEEGADEPDAAEAEPVEDESPAVDGGEEQPAEEAPQE